MHRRKDYQRYSYCDEEGSHHQFKSTTAPPIPLRAPIIASQVSLEKDCCDMPAILTPRG